MASSESSFISRGYSFKSGKYEVLRQIGQGGFGFVFLVKDKHDEDEDRSMS